ncbi:MAG TPA: hypothetical protein VFL69_07275 [Marmoricola sp.]|nr:hypothetical protein [Marmoricola sp.]
MSQRRVFLHIGAPKSGTTYLQDRFAANRRLLEEQGLSYPDTAHGGHFYAALDLIERRWAGEIEQARGQWDELAATARRADGDVLISHEILAAASPEQVRRAFRSLPDAEVHVVLTARDLARQLPAEWQEHVKHRSGQTFRKFANRVMRAPRTSPDLWFWRVQSVPDVLTRWGAGLPPSQVHVVTVPPSGAPPGVLWDRFADVLGLDPRLGYAEAERSNRSVGIAEIAVLRRLNRRLHALGVPREVYVPVVRELVVRDVFSRRPDQERAVVPPRRRPFVEEVTEEWLEWLEGSGVHVVGDLRDLQPVWPEPGFRARHPDRPRQGEVADAAIEALAAVVANSRPPEEGTPLVRVARKLLRP